MRIIPNIIIVIHGWFRQYVNTWSYRMTQLHFFDVFCLFVKNKIKFFFSLFTISLDLLN